MDSRLLGAVGPAVPMVGFGCMGLNSNYTETIEEEAKQTLRQASDLAVVGERYPEAAMKKLQI